MTDKIRTAIFDAIQQRTDEFNKANFPQLNADWTPEQQAIWEFLNGESGGLSRMHESDQPEISKTLAKLAGIEGMESRFSVKATKDIPPYTVVVLRENIDNYPAGFPLVTGRISGCWTEEATGSSRILRPQLRKMRPSTVDDVNQMRKAFPKGKLSKLYGVLPFADEAKLRECLAAGILAQTEKFAKSVQAKYPEGLTDKGKEILQLGLNATLRRALSIVLEDPKINEDFYPAPERAEFLPYCAVVHNADFASSSYRLNRVHVNADITPADVFFTYEDEAGGEMIGNHAESLVANLRPASEEEIKAYVQDLKADKLYLYASVLTEEQVTSLL